MIVFAKAPFCKLCHRGNLEKLPLTAGKVWKSISPCSFFASSCYVQNKQNLHFFFLLGLYKTGLMWQQWRCLLLNPLGCFSSLPTHLPSSPLGEWAVTDDVAFLNFPTAAESKWKAVTLQAQVMPSAFLLGKVHIKLQVIGVIL